jgi:protein gp37
VAERSSISWTHSTFNPWIGCTKVSPGCDHCYAEALDNRHRWGGEAHWGAGVPRRRTSLSNWKLPEKWERKAKATGERHLVFCASLADVFDNEAPEGAREDLWQLIRATPHLTWQLVTKRIGNAARMLPADWGAGYPNVWLLSTIVNQEEADRDLDKLLAVPARAAWRELRARARLGELAAMASRGATRPTAPHAISVRSPSVARHPTSWRTASATTNAPAIARRRVPGTCGRERPAASSAIRASSPRQRVSTGSSSAARAATARASSRCPGRARPSTNAAPPACRSS